MTPQEKEELFNEFVLKMAEMEREDKRLAVAKNNHCLAGVSRYYHENFDHTNPRAKHWEEVKRYYFVYNCYKKLRAAVPALVMSKKYRNPVTNANYNLGKKRGQCSSDPVLMEEDIQEADKAGKILLDAMWKYLTDGNEEAL